MIIETNVRGNLIEILIEYFSYKLCVIDYLTDSDNGLFTIPTKSISKPMPNDCLLSAQ